MKPLAVGIVEVAEIQPPSLHYHLSPPQLRSEAETGESNGSTISIHASIRHVIKQPRWHSDSNSDSAGGVTVFRTSKELSVDADELESDDSESEEVIEKFLNADDILPCASPPMEDDVDEMVDSVLSIVGKEMDLVGNCQLFFTLNITVFYYYHHRDEAEAVAWYGFLTGENCSICMDGLAGWRVVEMPCSHVFHVECLLLWLTLKYPNSCPLCRLPLCAAMTMEDPPLVIP